MVGNNNPQQAPSEETLAEALRSQLKSTAFWSGVAAIVGVIAFVAGGILYLAIEDIESFSLSVLIIGAALIFLAAAISPRAIAIFVVGRQARFGTIALVMTVAFFAIVVGINFLVYNNNTRFDVTATRFFTLAPQTTQILDSLDVQIRATAFYVEDDNQRVDVEDVLNEFALANENFEFRFVDPEVRRAVALNYNVTQFPAVVIENLATGNFSPAFIPPAISSLIDRDLTAAEQGFTSEALASLEEQFFLVSEQQLVEAMLVVTGVKRKKIYFLTGHKERPATRDRNLADVIEPGGLDLALEGMQRDNYAVQALNLLQIRRVPTDAAAIVVAGPQQNLDAQEYEALDEYLSGGGRMVIMLDPRAPETFRLLVAEWGINVAQENLADGGSSVAGQLLTPLVQRQNHQYPPNATAGYEITFEIDVTFFPGVTALALIVPAADRPPQTSFQPLAWTSNSGWFEDNLDRPAREDEQLAQYAVAGLLEACAKINAAPTVCSPQTTNTKLVVFGDSDFASNDFFTSRDNGDFFLNAVNYVTDDIELISIRPKVRVERDLTLTSNERDFVRWSSWLLPPALLMLIGVWVWWRRR